MKRILLFLLTNFAILIVASVTLRLLGFEPWLNQQGINFNSLLVFGALIGFGGAFVSLAMSKWSAKKMMGVQVIEQPRNDTERWLVQGGLSGTWRSDNFRITPEAEVTYINEKRESFSVKDDLGVGTTKIGSKTFSLGTLSVGPEIGLLNQPIGQDFQLEPHVALRLIWDFSVKGDSTGSGVSIYDDGARGEIEAGAVIRHNSGIAGRVALGMDGIGASDYKSYTGNLWLSIPF